MEHGQEQVALRAGGVAAARGVAVGLRARAAHPGRLGRAEHGIDGLALGRGGRLVIESQIHYLAGIATCPLSGLGLREAQLLDPDRARP